MKTLMRNLLSSLAAGLLCTLTDAHAIGTSFTFQGSLDDAGIPAAGSYDLQFTLLDASGVPLGGSITRDDVAVQRGLFAVELDFGSSAFQGDARSLRIAVRPGASTGAFTALAPDTKVLATPYAQIADTASFAASVADGSIDSAAIADQGITAADVAPGQVQLRVAQACAAGTAIRAVGSDGTVTCEAVAGNAGGDITGVAAGTGLTGGGAVGDVALAVAFSGIDSSRIADGQVGSADVNTAQVQLRVANSCAAGSAVRSVGVDGSVTCESVTGGTGDITAVTAVVGSGLTGGGTSGDVALAVAPSGIDSNRIADGQVGSADINSLQVQRRVATACAVGTSIRAIAQDGTVTCEADDAGVAGWALGGNSGTNPLTQFVGTTDAQPLEFRAGNERAWRLEVGTDSVNVTAFPRVNVITPGVDGGTIAGGGSMTSPNRVTDHFSTVGGGDENVAGSDNATLTYARATVGGGVRNVASGLTSTVGGGSTNIASGASSVVAGGLLNTASTLGSAVGGGVGNTAAGVESTVPGGAENEAGGAYSFAAGHRAKVRNAAQTGETVSCNGAAAVCGDEGTFVWSDTIEADFLSTGVNQFLVRAGGGVGFNTSLFSSATDLAIGARSGGDADVDVQFRTRNGQMGSLYFTDSTSKWIFSSGTGFAFGGLPLAGHYIDTATGAYLTSGGTWTNNSSRAFKHAFEAVDTAAILDAVLQLPMSTWEYIDSPEGRHLGPMAEDFGAAFGLGEDAAHITTVDADGVALAAIQGLNRKLEQINAELLARIATLEAESATRR